jgi:hypothetical protein
MVFYYQQQTSGTEQAPAGTPGSVHCSYMQDRALLADWQHEKYGNLPFFLRGSYSPFLQVNAAFATLLPKHCAFHLTRTVISC